MANDTYAALLNKKLVVPSQKTEYIAVDRNFFADVFAKTLLDVYVDESWYLEQSPDVSEAVRNKDFSSATDHFINVGFYEHRMPYEIDVNETWYLANYPDISEAVKKGVFSSGRAHFYLLGYKEGRFPHPKFELKTRASFQRAA